MTNSIDKLKFQRKELYTARNTVIAEKRSLLAKNENAKRASGQGLMLSDNEFYYRIGLDYRGRVYYRGSHMNPQMGDDVKSMIVFAKKKPLGVEGYKWLMWGIASAAGYDKDSFVRRIRWAVKFRHHIEDAVRNPLKSKFFKKYVLSGEPALFLQRAGEYVKALESGSFLSYETDISIAMDATCSGLQILSAVARDRDGAKRVNVARTEEGQTRKNDIYDSVLSIVKKKYASQDNLFAKHMTANANRFTRRFTKKVVMTLPYAAKENSARDTIRKELMGNMDKGDEPFPLPSESQERIDFMNAMNVLLNRNVIATETPDEYELYMKMSMILAKEVHAVCYDQLPAAMNLLAFFMSVPGSIPSHAYWKTPDGLAVKQIYGAKVAEPVRYRLEYTDEETGEITYKQVFNRYTFLDNDGKNRTKAANGMPPNWVHSLDGTLVRRVVLAVDFPVICIHDSFAAHPSDCGKLKIALQEQFSRLIVDRPLENLISYLNEQLGANVFSAENLIVDTLDPYEPLESEFIFC